MVGAADRDSAEGLGLHPRGGMVDNRGENRPRGCQGRQSRSRQCCAARRKLGTTLLEETGALRTAIRHRAAMHSQPAAAGRQIRIAGQQRGRDRREAEHRDQQRCQGLAHK